MQSLVSDRNKLRPYYGGLFVIRQSISVQNSCTPKTRVSQNVNHGSAASTGRLCNADDRRPVLKKYHSTNTGTNSLQLVLPDELTVAHLVTKLPAFYAPQKFFTASTTTGH